MDAELTSAIVERLQLLGPPLYTLETARQAAARSCTGTDCAALLRNACENHNLDGARILGGHVDEQRAGQRYLARLRVFRTDLHSTFPKSFYRWEYVQLTCAQSDCRRQVAELLATMIGQLLEDTEPVQKPAAMMDNASPPYCSGPNSLPVFLCAPANLHARCGDDGEPQADSGAAPTSLRCPLFGMAAGERCDCAHRANCTEVARAACSVSQETGTGTEPREHSAVLRKALGGTLLAAGGATLIGALLLTLNNHTSLTLRRDIDCSAGGNMATKCYAATGGVAATWVLGAGLGVGGVMVLADPLRFFAGSKKRGAAP